MITGPKTSKHSSFKFIAKNIWPVETFLQTFPDGLPTSTTGLWPVRVHHAGSFLVASHDFLKADMHQLIAGTPESTMTLLEKYLILFRLNTSGKEAHTYSSELNLEEKVKDIVNQILFSSPEKFQGYILYKKIDTVTRDDMLNVPFYDWVVEIFMDQGCSTKVNDVIEEQVQQLVKEGVTVNYGLFKDNSFLPNQ